MTNVEMLEMAGNLAVVFGYALDTDGDSHDARGVVRYCGKRNEVQILGPSYTITDPRTHTLNACGVSFIVTLKADGAVESSNAPDYVWRALRYHCHACYQSALRFSGKYR